MDACQFISNDVSTSPFEQREATKTRFIIAILLSLVFMPQQASAASAKPYTCPSSPHELPLPSSLPLNEYEVRFGQYLDMLCYRADRWARDKYVRNTGPHLVYPTGDTSEQTDPAWAATTAATHQAVWIYYSPDVYQWMLKREKQSAQAQLDAIEATANKGDSGNARIRDKLPAIPDGAMIIKEMWQPPAQQYTDTPEVFLKGGKINPQFAGWAIMIKDSQGSLDGWFWGYYYPGQAPDWPAGVNMANMGFGQYCLNCHASTTDESTFSSLRNVKGAPGHPLTFTTQEAPLESGPIFKSHVTTHGKRGSQDEDDNDCSKLSGDIIDCTEYKNNRISKPLTTYPKDFLSIYAAISKPPKQTGVQALPPAGYDHVAAGSKGPQEFLTADQCVGCHDAGGTGLQRSSMTIWLDEVKKYANLSPYGEWRQSPMGLAGRDPIFYAQLESEEKFHAGAKDFIQDTCLHCHGVMGQRQFHLDHPQAVCTAEDQSGCFLRSFTDAVPFPPDNPGAKHAEYGALARDGIACMVCHHMELPPLDKFAETFTGNYAVGPADELNGPFKDPKTKPMEQTFGITPKQNDQIRSSEICGSCHTIKLPVYDNSVPVKMPDGTPKYAYEQATYLEWLFSDFRKGEYKQIPNGSTPVSCQGCHMANAYKKPGNPEIKDLSFKMATIEEATNFPEADFRLPPEDIDLETREGFARHTLLGANLFILEMFKQFPTLLGVPTKDPMLGSSGQDSLVTASQSMISQADNHIAKLALKAKLSGGKLKADVKLANVNGHKFPSGVGFRRAFLSFEVLDKDGKVLWASGRTDDQGVIVDEKGQPIIGEFWQKADCSGPVYRPPNYPYQPHRQKITAQNQAQIYQELTIAPDGYLTTSFLGINQHLKDNRLLPKGFKTVFKDDSLKLDQQTLKLASLIGIKVKDPNELEFLQDIAPFGVGEQQGKPDPDYVNGSGVDSLSYEVALSDLGGKQPAEVRATLYSQSTPPFYLQDRFCTRPDGEDTQRLYFLTGHLNLDATRAEDWKFEITSASAKLP